LIVLRVIGEWWELELTGTDKNEAVPALAGRLTELDLTQELQFLPVEEAAAMRDLVQADGRLPVATFERRHGAVRLMGPGRLEREEPWFEPASTAEALWYRGLLYRGFDETAEGLLEFYYLPHEMMAPLAAVAPPPAALQESESTAVDDLTTLLAVAQRTALRSTQLDQLPALLLDADTDRRSLLINLAREMGMLRQTDAGIRPTRAAVSWLQSSREQQLRALAEAWSESGWNDLCHLPLLQCEGDQWHNDPLLGRTAFLEGVPRTADWYAVADLVAWFKNEMPDFQRPDGNYDTWYIRDVQAGGYLNGFENWELVEGRLLGFYIEGPLHWLGLTDLGEAGKKRCYRLTDRALEWLAGVPAAAGEVRSPLQVQPDAVIVAAPDTDRYARFQAARISEAAPVGKGRPYRYRITPGSLQRAGEEGISAERILQFLDSTGDGPLPPSTRRSITRWAERGVEARLEEMVVLRVRDSEILATLRSNARTRDYIDQTLGELVAMVRRENLAPLRSAAARLGLLLDNAVTELDDEA